jgi:hypothetical protein
LLICAEEEPTTVKTPRESRPGQRETWPTHPAQGLEVDIQTQRREKTTGPFET